MICTMIYSIMASAATTAAPALSPLGWILFLGSVSVITIGFAACLWIVLRAPANNKDMYGVKDIEPGNITKG